MTDRRCRHCGAPLSGTRKPWCSARCEWLDRGLPFRRCGYCCALFFPYPGEEMRKFLRRRYCHNEICPRRGRTVVWREDAVAVAVALLTMLGTAAAHEPEDEFADWYRSLQVPGSESSCCSPHRDCAPVDEYRGSASVPGGYDALYEGEWVPVPAQAVLQRADNPTGHAVLCIMRIEGKPVARCFVRTSEG